MPENSFSVKMESMLKSLGAASKFGRSSCAPVRRVDVEEARLERLADGAAEELVSRSSVHAPSTLKVGMTRDALREPSGERQVDGVVRGVEGHLRRQRPARRQERLRDAADGVRSHTRLALADEAVVGIGEAVELGLEGDLETGAPRRGVARADLRDTLVRGGDPRRRIDRLQHLPAQRPRVGRPVAERPRQQQVGLQQPRRRRSSARRGSLSSSRRRRRAADETARRRRTAARLRGRRAARSASARRACRAA